MVRENEDLRGGVFSRGEEWAISRLVGGLTPRPPLHSPSSENPVLSRKMVRKSGFVSQDFSSRKEAKIATSIWLRRSEVLIQEKKRANNGSIRFSENLLSVLYICLASADYRTEISCSDGFSTDLEKFMIWSEEKSCKFTKFNCKQNYSLYIESK